MPPFNALRFRFSQSLDIDRAVFFAITGKLWSLPAGLVTALLIAVFFSPELQGYYYTFNSVLGFQIFAELGLGTVLTYYASHEWAKLALDQNGHVTGDADALSRLTSLARFAFRWYLVAGAVMTVVLAAGGYFFFTSAEDPIFSWKAPWVALCVVTGLTLCMMPLWALLEGCNQVSNVYTFRFIQSVALGVAAWAAIYLGAELWAASISGMAGLLVMIILTSRRYGAFIGTILLVPPKGPRLAWRADILPMQWRIALSWISGYFVFFLFTPVLFHYQGPVVAGQMGMTWAFVGALAAVASSWVTPRAPRFGILIAQQRYAELDRLLWRITAVVFAVTAMGALCIWALVFVLNQLQHPFAARLLTPASTGYLLLATIITCASLPMSTYLRAHKKEPLLTLSVIGGLLTGIVVVVLGKHYSAEGVAIGYLAVTATVTPFVALIWHRRRAEWHAHISSRPVPKTYMLTARGQPKRPALRIRRLPIALAKSLALVVGFLPAFVLRSLNFRVLPVYASRIGHLALEIDSYLKEERLGLHPHYKAVLCAPENRVANRGLVEYWSSYIRVIRSPWVCLLLKPLTIQRILQFDVHKYATVINGTAAFFEIQKHWGDRPPLLSLRRDDIVRGERRLLELGMPANAWFVCVHSREGGYSPHDEYAHSYRNSDIDTYIPAMKAIVERGGWCVRIGDPSMKKLSPMPNVVDYAHHPLRADWMDLFLCARCRFFLGNSSGAFLMASIFGVPVALANLLPVSATLPYGKKDLGIPKLLWSAREQRVLTFHEILASPLGDMRFSSEYQQARIETIDNTPEDILGLALEQLERTEGVARYTAVDEDLQARFKALLKPGHYTYGSESRIGRDFLRKHAALL